MNGSFRFAQVGLAASLVLSSAFALAQDEAAGFALDRFEPSERGSDWFVAESLDLRGHQRFAVGLVLDYGYKPLVAYTPDGDEREAIVSHQLFGHVGGAMQMWNRVRFALNLPIALYQGGEGTGTSAQMQVTSDNATTVGDLRVAADVRLVGEYGDPMTLSGGLRLYAPTGSQDSFTSDGTVRAQPRVNVAGDVSMFTYAGQLSFLLRPSDDSFAGSATGSETQIALAAGARLLDRKLTVGPELYGSTVVTDGDAFFARRTTPFELLFGAHYTATGPWRFGAGVGPGLTRGFGTPKVRFLASVEFVEPFEQAAAAPPPPPSDRDGDGIIDDEDACPDVPGVRTADPARNGCPPDRDGDGVLDAEDACPDVPGVRTEDPKTNGCPPPSDRDGDGIIDEQDACPDEPGVRTDDPKTNGCPPPKDRDGDGILDGDDACPDVAGPPNDDPKKHGCPAARIEQGQIKIREQVQFAYNSARILNASDTLLEAVKQILVDHPEIKKVSVEGHTDNRGSAVYNKGLSNRRAKSVVDWLVKRGIDRGRLSSTGFGLERPIDSNDTEEGRQNNRRVEFHIADQPEPSAKP
jgi:outer membrane protein OmpA-like peptidoglycan-associated protein